MQQNVKLLLMGTGLGDQIEYEPIIRYALFNDYKICKTFTIITNYPDVYSHFNTKDFKPKVIITNDLQKFEKDNIDDILISVLPDKNHPIRKLIKPLWCTHPTDWISLMLLGRLISNNNKQIELNINTDIISSKLKEMITDKTVLIHPGKNDEFRTFPDEYWIELIKRIEETSVYSNIIIVGKEIGSKGFNSFISTKSYDNDTKIIDLRNITSFNDLLFLIYHSSALISNDSGPIHMAGVSPSCYIILLNSLKQPEYILPFRTNEGQNYLTINLCKKLISEDFDISRFNLNREKTPPIPNNILDYAPDIDDILNVIVSGKI